MTAKMKANFHKKKAEKNNSLISARVLYKSAVAVEKDSVLRNEMGDWDVTLLGLFIIILMIIFSAPKSRYR